MSKEVEEEVFAYALGLKANRGRLFATAEQGFAAVGERACFETTNSAHGRTETRRAWVLPLARLEDPPDFPGLKAIGRIQASRGTATGNAVSSVRYVALSGC